jgi:tripartite-type tricarboxylate transporter receptor subunit TctC
MIVRRRIVLALAFAAVFSGGVRAQDYPNRPVRIIVPTASPQRE